MSLYRRRGGPVDNSHPKGGGWHGSVQGEGSIEVHSDPQGGVRNGGRGHDHVPQGTDSRVQQGRYYVNLLDEGG